MFPSLIIFDLDGTLIDSAGDIARAVNRMLIEFGRSPLDLAAIREMIGDGAPALVNRALAATDRNKNLIDPRTALDRFLALYGDDHGTHTVTYPGVHEVLDALAAQNIPLAICTNKPARPAIEILAQLGLTRFFRQVVGGDSFPWRKPDPRTVLDLCAAFEVSVEHTVLVGDSEVDARTAEAAGMRFILMTYGYHRGPVELIDCTARLDSFHDLTSLLCSPSTRIA